MLLYLSSHWNRVCRGQSAEQLAGDVALQGAHDFLGRSPLGSTTDDVGAGRGICPHADNDDGRERAIQPTVAAAVEAVAHGIARRRGDRAGSSQ